MRGNGSCHPLGLPPFTVAYGVLNFVPSAPLRSPLRAFPCRLAALRLPLLSSPVWRVALFAVPSWGKAGFTVRLEKSFQPLLNTWALAQVPVEVLVF